MLRFVVLGFVAAACGGLAVALVSSTACVVAPPPELPELPEERPTILHESLVPPSDQILVELPGQFLVPVELVDSNQSFQWDVFVDYNPCVGASCPPTAPALYPTTVPAGPDTLDGGVVIVPFSLGPLDPSLCHRIDFLVAHQFDPGSARTWDSVGGDIATWIYNPGGQPNGCPIYDAGAFQDGAFPPSDAGLPIVPESGTGDP
jgi:hypothetical protein